MAYGVHYFTQLGPSTCYSRGIVRTVSSAFACTEDIFYIMNTYYTHVIAQASEVRARVLYVLQHVTYFIHGVFILLLLPHGSKQGTVFHICKARLRETRCL
jgi:hypothetical protein